MFNAMQRRARIPPVKVLAMVAAAALAGAAVLAAEPPVPSDSVSAVVRLSDLDLSTPEGSLQARQRLEAAAARLCRKFRDTRSLAFRETEAQCRHDALQAVLEQIRPTTLAESKPAMR